MFGSPFWSSPHLTRHDARSLAQRKPSTHILLFDKKSTINSIFLWTSHASMAKVCGSCRIGSQPCPPLVSWDCKINCDGWRVVCDMRRTSNVHIPTLTVEKDVVGSESSRTVDVSATRMALSMILRTEQHGLWLCVLFECASALRRRGRNATREECKYVHRTARQPSTPLRLGRPDACSQLHKHPSLATLDMSVDLVARTTSCGGHSTDIIRSDRGLALS